MTRCRPTSTPTASWSTRWSTRATRRSAVPRAPASRSRAPIRAAGGGPGRPRPNAGCTRPDDGTVSVLVLTAHGSADPRSAVTTHAVADTIRRLRPGLDVVPAFCEQTAPNLVDV